MAIEKFDMDEYEVSCDKCSYEEYMEASYFDELIEEMKKRDWKSIKTKTGWDNICPSCVFESEARI